MDRGDLTYVISIGICLCFLAWMFIPAIWMNMVPDSSGFGSETINEKFINSEITIINSEDGQIIYCIYEFLVEDNKLRQTNKVVLMTFERHWFFRFYVGSYKITELEHNCSDCGSATTTCLT